MAKKVFGNIHARVFLQTHAEKNKIKSKRDRDRSAKGNENENENEYAYHFISLSVEEATCNKINKIFTENLMQTEFIKPFFAIKSLCFGKCTFHCCNVKIETNHKIFTCSEGDRERTGVDYMLIRF